MPGLLNFAGRIDHLNRWLGKLLSWTVVLLILVQFALVIMTNVFRIGSIQMQESLLYLNAAMFLGAAGYTLFKDAHVRVDIFYRGASARFRALVNLWGSLLLLLPVTGLIFWVGIPYVAASWATFEGSVDSAGIRGVFLLKSMILVFGASLGLQGISLAIRSAATLTSDGRGDS